MEGGGEEGGAFVACGAYRGFLVEGRLGIHGWREAVWEKLYLVIYADLLFSQVVLYYMESSRSSQSWLSSGGRQIDSTGRQGAPEIEYRDVEDPAEDESIQNEITRLNSESELATQIEGRRTRPSQLIHEQDQRREE